LRIVITDKCNQKCIYCNAVDSLDTSSYKKTDILKKILSGIQKDTLVFSGGEPTLEPLLEDYIRFAKKCRYKNIVVLSNGVRLACNDYCLGLKKAGLTGVQLSVPHYDAAVFDSITSGHGHLKYLIEAARNLNSSAIDLFASVVISAFNYRALDKLAAFVHARLKIKNIIFYFIERCLNVDDNPWTVPDIRDSMPFIRKAIKYCRKHDIRHKFSGTGLPFCILKLNGFGFEREDFIEAARSYRRPYLQLPRAVCRNCPETTECPWGTTQP